MPVPLYVVDAFTKKPFSGNPAAVCVLESECPADWMQRVAMEMNLSETAFARRTGEGWALRWFTANEEVNLCGHATLATAHVLWETGRVPVAEALRFATRSGILVCSSGVDGPIRMDFPADPVKSIFVPRDLDRMLGARPLMVAKGAEYMVVEISPEAAVRGLRPHLGGLSTLDAPLVIVTAEGDPGSGFDFVSRCFAPKLGIAEDPVTGSAHCTLASYWAKRLGKTKFRAYQASARGGELEVELLGDRVILAGYASMVSRGELLVPLE